ncbi:MAG: hypothetical protein CML22_07140 [Rheinheimera sp.]|nr:hypothetical protein [Rheinheimera sp.]|tara:strand:- start:859 stop:1332 length:474 start_codon:yes stop_codon:yes gene_type:complete
MEIAFAKLLNSAVINCILSIQGVSSPSEDHLKLVKSASLSEMLHASEMVEMYNESADDGGPIFVTTTESAIADLFLRLRSENYFHPDELVEACQAFDDMNPDTLNGHGMMIDGYGNHSLIELNHGGDGAVKTVAQASSLQELMDKLHAALEHPICLN